MKTCTQLKYFYTPTYCNKLFPNCKYFSREQTCLMTQHLQPRGVEKGLGKENIITLYIFEKADIQSRLLLSRYCIGWLFMGPLRATTKVTAQRDPRARQQTALPQREG